MKDNLPPNHPDRDTYKPQHVYLHIELITPSGKPAVYADSSFVLVTERERVEIVKAVFDWAVIILKDQLNKADKK